VLAIYRNILVAVHCNMSSTNIYHLVQKSLWHSAKAANVPYFPPTYEQDGFIHATAEYDALLGVANLFYTGVKDDFLCLSLRLDNLTSEVKFEAAAPVGEQAAAKGQQLFPHIYGAIDMAAVEAEWPVIRDAEGQFLSIQK
jgi:uncharacterized protein (DUF952 family)